jgi:hypothetical protein
VREISAREAFVDLYDDAGAYWEAPGEEIQYRRGLTVRPPRPGDDVRISKSVIRISDFLLFFIHLLPLVLLILGVILGGSESVAQTVKDSGNESDRMIAFSATRRCSQKKLARDAWLR